MAETIRVNHQIGYLLNTRPWKESSLLIDIFTQDYGKKILIARGARKATSALRGVLNPFTPISFSWFGKNSLLTLHQASWIGGQPMPQGIALLSSWYINELVFKLVPPNDPHPKIFIGLKTSMLALANNQDPSSQLRKFEWILLNELGLAPSILVDIYENPIKKNHFYQVKYESNLIPIYSEKPHIDHFVTVSGETLININREDYTLEKTRQEAREFFQYLIAQHIPNHQIVSSHILKQLFQSTLLIN
ncbi:MAG: DNA repair protein RecO [Neisseriaceae bacterium]|nr:MAG: DNA repair protein RecO [Neisseriaceae bacterium]